MDEGGVGGGRGGGGTDKRFRRLKAGGGGEVDGHTGGLYPLMAMINTPHEFHFFFSSKERGCLSE